MLSREAIAIAFWIAAAAGPAAAAGTPVDARQEACKKAMSARIEVCADECTKAALAAVPDFKDKNNDVKFLCIKRCATRAIVGGQGCTAGGN